MLQIRKLNFSYGDLQVLWDVDLEVKQGEIVTVVGANGAGKSTILKNVSRLVRPTRGTHHPRRRRPRPARSRTRWSSTASSRCRRGAASSRR